MKKLFLILFSFLIVILSEGNACTGVLLKAKDGSTVHGRTLEFGTLLPTTVAVVPRGYPFTGTTMSGDGLKYVAKYASVGAYLFDKVSLLDGMNEKGLSVGTFFFPGFAEYTPLTKENQQKALSPSEFPNWLLSQFTTVGEVKSALSSVIIVPTIEAGWGKSPPPFHYIVYDKTGGCIVIEPVHGKLVTYENSLGVLTNSPTFEWHITNLRNYINLRTDNVPPVTIDGVELSSLGQGSGMVGLPGDFTPPSRFVRAVIFSHSAIPSETSEDAVFQTFHILNLFDIPLGVTREVKKGKIQFAEFTSITCVRDPQTLRYYYKGYEDQTIKMIDMNVFNLDAISIQAMATRGSPQAIDVSNNLQSL